MLCVINYLSQTSTRSLRKDFQTKLKGMQSWMPRGQEKCIQKPKMILYCGKSASVLVLKHANMHWPFHLWNLKKCKKV